MNNVLIYLIPFKITAVTQTHMYVSDFNVIIMEIISVVKKFIAYIFHCITYSITFKILLVYGQAIANNTEGLLIFDNHAPHTSVKYITYCGEKGIILYHSLIIQDTEFNLYMLAYLIHLKQILGTIAFNGRMLSHLGDIIFIKKHY